MCKYFNQRDSRRSCSNTFVLFLMTFTVAAREEMDTVIFARNAMEDIIVDIQNWVTKSASAEQQACDFTQPYGLRAHEFVASGAQISADAASGT